MPEYIPAQEWQVASALIEALAAHASPMRPYREGRGPYQKFNPMDGSRTLPGQFFEVVDPDGNLFEVNIVKTGRSVL
jgi:hypothetical protein